MVKTKIDIISGFLGAGKTTLIKKLIQEAFKGQQIVLIENEFGEIGIDGSFMREAGIKINELNSGCICCSLVGDFRAALGQVVEQYHPDRILIEPSGVGKLSDVTRAVEAVAAQLPVELNSFVTVADVNKVKMYMKNFGEFYIDQVSHASCLILSRTATASEEKLNTAVTLLKEKNPAATIVTGDWNALSGEQIASVMSGKRDLVAELLAKAEAANLTHADEDEEEEEEEHAHHHHHHAHDEDGDGAHHEHEGHDHEAQEHHHHHHHHGEHDADEIFTSWGSETALRYTRTELEGILKQLDSGACGDVLRAKGIVDGSDSWYEFDMVPGEQELRPCAADVTGKLCVIGSDLKEQEIAALFRL